MSAKIEWCDETWNPVVGCTKVSPGCANCYAARMASRFNRPGEAFDGTAEGGNWTGKVLLKPDKLDQPLKWRKPRRVFVNSMSDLFHPDVPFEFIRDVFTVMSDCPQHTFMVLTKRPECMAERMTVLHSCLYKQSSVDDAEGYWSDILPLPNVWLGVSVEDQATADERIPWLLRTPAAVRFVSCEPLLGPVDLEHVNLREQPDSDVWNWTDALAGAAYAGDSSADVDVECNRLDWVITGGETGPGARPAHPDWFRGIRDACQAAGVSYFHKQNGEWAMNTEPVDLFNKLERHFFTAGPGTCAERVGKKAAGRLLDGVEHNAIPEETR